MACMNTGFIPRVYLSLLVSSGKLSLISPWLSKRMSWEVMPLLTSRPKTNRRSTAPTLLHTFRLAEVSKIYEKDSLTSFSDVSCLNNGSIKYFRTSFSGSMNLVMLSLLQN